MANEVSIVVTGKDQSGPAFRSASQNANQLGSTLGRVGTIAAGILAADVLQGAAQRVTQFIGSTISAASNLQQSMGGVKAIFGTASKAIDDFGNTSAEAVGLSKAAFSSLAAPLGASLKLAGFSMDEVSKKTIQLTERAADMAATFGGTTKDALEAIQSALRGEFDPIERFGVGLTAARVEARALADTGKSVASSLTDQEKAMARINLILEQTTDTAGQFRREQDSLSGAMQITNAKLDDAKAKLGTALLPILATAAQVVGTLAEGFSKLPQPLQLTVAAAAALGAAAVILIPAIAALKISLAELGVTASLTSLKLSTLAGALGIAGLAIAAYAEVSREIPTVTEHAQKNTDKLTSSLLDLARTGKVSGEVARVFGEDLKGMQRVAVLLDDIMVGMVNDGHIQEAANLVLLFAKNNGVSAEQIRQLLPQYDKLISGNKNVADSTYQAYSVMKGAWQSAFSEFRSLELQHEGLLESQKKKTELTTTELIRQLTRQKNAQKQWADDMMSLVGVIPDAMLEELRALGPKGAEVVRALAAGTPAQRAQIISLWYGTGTQMGSALASGILAKIGAISAAAAAAARAAQINRQTGGNRFESGGNVGAQAGGARGGFVEVGEHGRELVRLPYGSSVVSNPDTERMMAASGGSGAVQIEMSFKGNLDSAFATYFMKLLRTGQIQISQKAIV